MILLERIIDTALFWWVTSIVWIGLIIVVILGLIAITSRINDE